MEEGVDNQGAPKLPRKEGTFAPEGLPIETINNVAVNVLLDFVSGKENGMAVNTTVQREVAPLLVKGLQIFARK